MFFQTGNKKAPKSVKSDGSFRRSVERTDQNLVVYPDWKNPLVRTRVFNSVQVKSWTFIWSEFRLPFNQIVLFQTKDKIKLDSILIASS